ncbi:hypothetical protein BO83DRAFT_417870 [Aspergillus eucalypticola CBS 122712]|uniref:F-box domain-containing protein n=1 Tax=Aspergillus eucalypticola (strain CBS 122712 / IBT 29274) TaxID=1448314 RepID=A0A317VAL9_ASPEC|nr:uncharacterized protein BO83DRAFT_417870 [Aspergillus eucalypticola CBS 122712]PWY71256.1 hypothetical protein BO83DRAFT_417870 [Aspergillus eucalypticola CBS 122712]
MLHFCTICGVIISTAPEEIETAQHPVLEWYQTLRLVRRKGCLAPVTLSGIGYVSPGDEIVAPPCAEESFTHSSASLQTHVPFFDRGTGHWTFPFHAICWKILLERVPEATSDIFRTCTTLHGLLYCTVWDRFSFPRPGHDFGDAVQSQKPVGNPVRNMLDKGYTHLLADPSRQAALKDFPFLDSDCDPYPRVMRQRDKDNHHYGGDAFSNLPLEVIYMVLTYLRSAGLNNLRLASRSISSVTQPQSLPQNFWKSRFSPSFEMGYALPIESGSFLNWRDIYFKIKRAVGHSQCSDGLKNRHRIWKIVSLNADLIGQLITEVSFSHIMKSCDSSPDNRSTVRQKSTRFITTQETTNHRGLLESGCRKLYNSKLLLPITQGSIRSIETLITAFNSQTYISGFRFTLANDIGEKATRCLGYTSCHMRPLANLDPCESIAGFGVAISAGGIVGVRLIVRRGYSTYKTKWVGETGCDEPDIAFGELIADGPVDELAISAHFDSFKLVALGINDEASPDAAPPARPQPIWTPYCPRDTSILLPQPQFPGYQSFNRILNIDFGGTYGQRLGHLTRIVAHMLTAQSPIVGLSFYYDRLDPMHFGRQGMTEVSFLIDGPSGERIRSVTVDRASTSQGVVALKMLTSFGNEITFMANYFAGPYVADSSMFYSPDEALDTIQYIQETLETPLGHIIVGFTSVLEAVSGSFQTFGLQYEKTNASEAPDSGHRGKPRKGVTSADLADFRGSSLIGEKSKGCHAYTSASLEGVKRIRISQGCHSRPRRTGEISGLWLEYSDSHSPCILGQWISEIDSFTLEEDEVITEIRIWFSKGRISFAERYPLGRVIRIAISTRTQSQTYPLGKLPAPNERTELVFRGNDVEYMSRFIWAFNDCWDFPRVILSPISPRHRVSLWDPMKTLEVRPWMAPRRALWKLNNGAGRLISVDYFLYFQSSDIIGGLRFTYESGYCIDIGSVGDTTISSGMNVESDDRIDRVVLFYGAGGLVNISLSFNNSKSGQLNTRALRSTSMVYQSHDVIDLSKRRYELFSDACGWLEGEGDVPSGEVIGLWGFDSVQCGLYIGLILLEEETD